MSFGGSQNPGIMSFILIFLSFGRLFDLFKLAEEDDGAKSGLTCV